MTDVRGAVPPLGGPPDPIDDPAEQPAETSGEDHMATSFAEALNREKAAKRDHRDVDVVLDSAVADRLRAIETRIAELESEKVDLDISDAALDEELEQLRPDLRLGDKRPKEIEERKAEHAKRRKEIEEQIEQREQERNAAAEGTYWTFRFVQLPGQDWAEIIARHPPRPDVPIDRRYGYNYHGAAKQAAEANGAVVVREPAEEENAEDVETLERLDPEQWHDLWTTLSGHEVEKIASAVWDLNEYGPQQKLDAAGKASRVGTASRSS